MNKLISTLEKLDSLSVQEGVSKHFIEITSNNSETVVSANKEGLVWLALECLKLAEKKNVGSHIHIDECGIADKAKTNLVLTYKSAEWES